MMGQRLKSTFVILLLLTGCDVVRGADDDAGGEVHSEYAAQTPEIDLDIARKKFSTKLVVHGPAPQTFEPALLPSGVREITYVSDGLELKAWVSDGHDPKEKVAAVVYLHGGWAFDRTDWDDVQPFLDAGYVVMAPMLRGENGNPGEYQAFYGEVDDAVAAGRHLATIPGVDPDRIFLSGHSVGGVLAVLASMVPSNYRAAAPLSGYLEMNDWSQDPDRRKVVYDIASPEEIRLRNPMAFAASLKIPIHLYTEPGVVSDVNREFMRRALKAEKSCEHTVVPGDHASMKVSSIRQAVAWFNGL